MKVIAINGSPRKDGNTFHLISKVFEALNGAGVETEIVQIGGKKIRGCTACGACFEKKNGKCVIDDDFNEAFGKMASAEGIILGSPTYFTDVTAEMKALIDRAGFVAMANGCLFRHKAAAAVVAVRRGGAIHCFDTMNHLFQISQMFIVGSTYWNVGIGLEKGDVLNDQEGVANMADIGKSMAFLLKKLHQ